MEYVELRTRSAFSFLAGGSLPEDLVARAAALDHGVIAMGDRGGLYGAPRVHKAAVQAGLRAIVGCALTMAGGGELYLLIAERAGYRNLCRLLTDAALRAPKGEAVPTWGDLEGRSDGLICLTREVAWIERLRRFFPGRLYLELQRHLDPAEERENRVLVAAAERHGLPLVATNDVRHATAEGRSLLDVLTCLREKTTLDAAGRRLLGNAERHLKSARDMAGLFRDRPEALRNTRRIAEQCAFTLADLGYRFPDYPLPPGETAIGHLRALAYDGARRRYGRITARVRAQLEHELAVIGQLDLAGYFLIVWDIVRFCRAAGILAQGRGSAANSAVCYALGITAVDPVGMELLFERFLSPERGEWPDIDIDLPSGDQRERVIQYVYQRYGARGAAMTANVITYRTRSAVREVGKVLGFSEAQVGRLSKLLHRFEFRDDLDELAVQLRAGGVDPAAPRVRLLVDLVARIQNLPRHLGQHSGGMVIAAGRLDEVVPLEPAAMPGRVVVQWDKDDCADLGIIKVDLLGLGMMAVLEETIPLIREHEGVEVDLARLPPDDPATYAMIRRADTVGVFQIESRAQMATLPRLRPERFYDLVVEVALIRPGPIVGQMVHPYINRRRGREPVRYAHPDLEPILRRTLGVPLFQEQLLRMAMTVAGFTGGEAEELRRAMGFKRSVARMREIEARLRAGMRARGITGAAQDAIVKSITSFALYGFPESHAASFALLAYASAYLRRHHLAAFTCALLNNWPMGFYHPATLVKDAQRHGLRVRPVDVTRSEWKCTLEEEVGGGDKAVGLLGCCAARGGNSGPLTANSLTANSLSPRTANSLSLRLGLRYIAGLREDAGRRIEAARAGGAFESLADVAIRAALRDDELQSLAHAGAFAAFGLTRRQALWQVGAVPKGALFRFQDPMRRIRGEGIEERDTRSDAEIVPGVVGVASGDAFGEELLHADEIAAARGDVRTDEPDSSRGDLGAGQHRGGQWPRDTRRVHRLPADRPGEPAGAGDLYPVPDRGGDDARGSRESAPATTRLGRPAPEPPDPIPAVRSPDSVTANSRTASLLPEMSPLDRTLADYTTLGLTPGPHLLSYLRAELAGAGVLSTRDLARAIDGCWVKVAGLVIVRQRPGSAKGFCFLTLEDETGIGNAVVTRDIFQRHRSVIHTASLLLVEGPVQRVDDVVHVRAGRFTPLRLPEQSIGQTGHGYRMRVTPEEEPPPLPRSHDFR
jgi:error-prone DNA polymerase